MRIGSVFILVVLAGSLAACATAQTAKGPGPMYVPTGVQTGSDAAARFVLPTDSLAEAAIPRLERTAAAPDVGYSEAFSDYTYDIQQIGIRPGYGYRYRSVIRVGGNFP